MTPPASSATVAAPRARRRRPSDGHRAQAGSGAAARPARRMSGPAGGAHALPRPVGLPAQGARLGARLRALPDHRFVDRLLRGRVWIPFVALFLCGIVATQVHLLKLNAGISRAVEASSTLQRENAALRASIGRLSSGDRLHTVANHLGLVDPPAGSVQFLRTHPGDARKAAASMSKPEPDTGTSDAATTASTPTTTGTTPSTTGMSTAGTTATGTMPSTTTGTTPSTTGSSTAGTTATSTTPSTTTTTGTTPSTAAAPVTTAPSAGVTPATSATSATTAPGVTR
jgi:hypothetical protein